MKLCKDCKWFKRDFISGNEFGRCAMDNGGELSLNPVTGKRTYPYFASVQRIDYSIPDFSCGSDAKWFEPKEISKSFWKRLFNWKKK